LSSDSEEFPNWSERGKILYQEGNFKEAIEYLKKALEIKPDETDNL
jgi:tetratricopeptide (TPR) repeat protein